MIDVACINETCLSFSEGTTYVVVLFLCAIAIGVMSND
jgi:hypothetical protein